MACVTTNLSIGFDHDVGSVARACVVVRARMESSLRGGIGGRGDPPGEVSIMAPWVFPEYRSEYFIVMIKRMYVHKTRHTRDKASNHIEKGGVMLCCAPQTSAAN